MASIGTMTDNIVARLLERRGLRVMGFQFDRYEDKVILSVRLGDRTDHFTMPDRYILLTIDGIAPFIDHVCEKMGIAPIEREGTSYSHWGMIAA